ncbi:MAG: phage neck terminator protein [Candidatus Binatia bacterium]
MTATYANITETNAFTALRALMLAYVDCEVIRAPVNRAAMPKNDFIALTPGRMAALETNAHTYSATQETVKRPTQFTIQGDFYGARAGDRAHAVSTLFRDEIACRFLANSGFDIQPLFASDPQQLPIVTGEEQYLERWTTLFELQMNPILTLTIETADTLTVGVLNVDREYPPN